LLFCIYLYFLYMQEQHHSHHKAHLDEQVTHVWRHVLSLLVGMGALLWSSAVCLEAIQYIVTHTGVSGSLIGVIALWISSALPEMITALSGVRKKADGISIGTLIWSNIVNPLVAIGLGGLISSYYVPQPLKFRDLPMQIITALILLWRIMKHQGKLWRQWGVFLMLLYLWYILIRIHYFAID
jgi:cation:H+ antiporter